MSSVSKTAEQLIYEAASDIGAVGPGEVLSAEDYAKFDTKLDSLLEELNESYSIYIADKNDIPNPYFLTLARLLGNVAGSAVVAAPMNDAAWQRDIQSLKRMAASRPAYSTLKNSYF